MKLIDGILAAANIMLLAVILVINLLTENWSAAWMTFYVAFMYYCLYRRECRIDELKEEILWYANRVHTLEGRDYLDKVSDAQVSGPKGYA